MSTWEALKSYLVPASGTSSLLLLFWCHLGSYCWLLAVGVLQTTVNTTTGANLFDLSIIGMFLLILALWLSTAYHCGLFKLKLVGVVGILFLIIAFCSGLPLWFRAVYPPKLVALYLEGIKSFIQPQSDWHRHMSWMIPFTKYLAAGFAPLFNLAFWAGYLHNAAQTAEHKNSG